MTWWWMGVVLAAVGGLAAGYLVGRLGSADMKRSKALDEDLRETRRELDTYRESVHAHFNTTAQLVNRLTDDYRAVYQHLARGARDLTGGRTEQLDALAPPPSVRSRLADRDATPLPDGDEPALAPAVEQPAGESDTQAASAADETTVSTDGPAASGDSPAGPAAEAEPADAREWQEGVAPVVQPSDHAREERRTGS